MRKILSALFIALGFTVLFASNASASYYDIPQNNSGVISRKVSHSGATETISVRFRDGGSRKFVTTESCRSGRCTLKETITDVTRKGKRATGSVTCTWLTRDPQNTNRCTFR